MALSDAAKFAAANKKRIQVGDQVFVASVLRRGIVSHIIGSSAVVTIDGVSHEAKIEDLSIVNGLSY